MEYDDNSTDVGDAEPAACLALTQQNTRRYVFHGILLWRGVWLAIILITVSAGTTGYWWALAEARTHSQRADTVGYSNDTRNNAQFRITITEKKLWQIYPVSMKP